MSVQTNYNVTGMSCGGCAKKLRRELEKLPGFVDVSIDPRAGKVDLTTADQLSESDVQKSVETAGFTYAGAIP
jgi:copper chaperone CopZ